MRRKTYIHIQQTHKNQFCFTCSSRPLLHFLMVYLYALLFTTHSLLCDQNRDIKKESSWDFHTHTHTHVLSKEENNRKVFECMLHARVQRQHLWKRRNRKPDETKKNKNSGGENEYIYIYQLTMRSKLGIVLQNEYMSVCC